MLGCSYSCCYPCFVQYMNHLEEMSDSISAGQSDHHGVKGRKIHDGQFGTIDQATFSGLQGMFDADVQTLRISLACLM